MLEELLVLPSELEDNLRQDNVVEAEVKLSSWRYRVAEPLKRVAKDSEARSVLLAIRVG